MSELWITITDVMFHMGHTQMFGIHSVYSRIGMLHAVAESNRHGVIPNFYSGMRSIKKEMQTKCGCWE